MTDIHIAYGISPDNWFNSCHFSIVSILLNARPEDNYHFHILSKEFPEDVLNKFYSLSNLRQATFDFHVIDPEDFKGIVHDHILGESAYYRLKMPSFIQQDKCLYLDADTMVVKDISELYNINVDNYFAGMVEDKSSATMRCRCSEVLKEGATFFNSGVMLLNLKAIRAGYLEKAWFDILKTHKYTDQDAINHVFCGRILSLPLKYNIVPILSGTVYETRLKEYIFALKDPTIVHPPFYQDIVEIKNLYNEYRCKYDKVMNELGLKY